MSFNTKLLEIFKNEGISTAKNAEIFFEKEITLLQESGKISLGLDQNLGGFSLELRVKELFKSAGFNIENGRKGYEDFTINADKKFSTQESIVIEVKSSKSAVPKLDDLRQLDDWVFKLSGEEDARKNGITSYSMFNTISQTNKHPTPYKGLFIFNGPIGIDFESRSKTCIHPSQMDFVITRNFCIITLNALIDLLKNDDEFIWNTIHNTVGEYLTSS